MVIKSIKQAVSSDSLFNILAEWCKKGAGKTSHSLKILTAFASGLGVRAISPFLDVFLADGNSVQVIFGIDRKGTDRDAVRCFSSLQRAYPKQVDIWVFQAPNPSSIFHPKLYVYQTNSDVNFIIGSANLTSGGLASNLESLLLYEGIDRKSRLAREVLSIWQTYARPSAPLSPTFLRQVTGPYAERLLKSLPRRTHQEFRSGRRKIQALWRPISRLPLPKSVRFLPRERLTLKRLGRDYLLMDVLRETRKTQMQIPLDVVERFFGIPRGSPAAVNVSIWTREGLTQPIHRPLVMSRGVGMTRLMRRLEMPQIKGLERPLAVLFLRLPGKRKFAHCLLPRDTGAFRSADQILGQHGQQDHAVRRFIIGQRGDRLWKRVSLLLGA